MNRPLYYSLLRNTGVIFPNTRDNDNRFAHVKQFVTVPRR